MAQPWPLVSVLSKPAQCEGQDSTRVTIHRTFQSTHQGLGSRGPKAGGHWRGTGSDGASHSVLLEPVHLGKEAAVASLGHELPSAADVPGGPQSSHRTNPTCGPSLLPEPEGSRLHSASRAGRRQAQRKVPTAPRNPASNCSKNLPGAPDRLYK